MNEELTDLNRRISELERLVLKLCNNLTSKGALRIDPLAEGGFELICPWCKSAPASPVNPMGECDGCKQLSETR